MTENNWGATITSPESMLKGFIAGFLIGGGLFNPVFGVVIDIILVALGILAFLDAIIPSSKNIHGFTVIVLALVGGLVVFALSITGSAAVFIAVAVIISVLIHLRTIMTNLHVLSK